MAREIPLTQGYIALVDDEDYDKVSQFKWCAIKEHGNVYAARVFQTGHGETRKLHSLRMHRFILGITDSSVFTDHWDHNGINNQKHNLRTCTHTQNRRNERKRIRPNTSSQYKGVFRGPRDRKWYAHLTFNRQRVSLGSFLEEIDAALAYDRAALAYFGEFAYLNFPAKPMALDSYPMRKE